jgi:hypothetical protein
VGFFSYLTYLIENNYIGKYYEDLDTLIQLIKKIDKKHQLAEFIIRVARTAQKNHTKSISDVIKEAKKEFD